MKLRSNEPFWLVKNGLIRSYPSLYNNLDVDVLIVGSGITGSLIAHQCVADGYRTALVDRREIAHGSSSATTSMLQYEIDTPLFELIEMIGEEGAVASYRACSDSIDQLGRVVRKVKSKCGFDKKRSLYFAALKKDVPDLEREIEARKTHGFDVKWLTADEIEKSFGVETTHGGILSQQGGSLDAFQLAHDLLKYNTERCLTVYDQTEIVDVTYRRSGVTAKTQYGNKIAAKKIIYCTGFESVELIKDKFVDLKSTYAIVGEQLSEMPEPHFAKTLIWNTADPYLYLRMTDDRRILIGGEDEEFVDAQKRDELIHKKALTLKKKLLKLFPDLEFRIDFAWAGTFWRDERRTSLHR